MPGPPTEAVPGPPTEAVPGQLPELAARWTELGRHDPMWAALTDRSRSGRGRSGGWTETDFLATGRREIERLLARLAALGVPPRRETALDFGCGPGRLTLALAAAGFARVVGVDISPSMLDAARQLAAADPVTARRCEFRHNDGPALAGVADDSVDLVYTARVLQHLPPVLTHAYLREFFRVTAPGGLVVFQLPAETARGIVGAALRWTPTPLLDRLRRGMRMHATPPTRVTELVAAAGGRTVTIEPDTSAGPRWRSYLYITEVGHPRRDAPNRAQKVPVSVRPA